MPEAYTVALPAGLPLLNANERLHWRKKNDRTQAIADAAIVMARKAKIPTLDKVTITVVYHPNAKRRLDPHNWYPTVKAAIDGIVRAGVLPDDDHTHLLGVDIILGDPVPGSQLVLHITPLPAARPT